MKVSIVHIGNSQGLRIPKALLDLCHIQKEVDLEVQGDAIMIHPVKRRSRKGWAEKFKLMHSRGEDELLVNDALDLEMGAWEW